MGSALQVRNHQILPHSQGAERGSGLGCVEQLSAHFMYQYVEHFVNNLFFIKMI
jgi:hypothetical protein